MFQIDECKNFWNDVNQVSGHLFIKNTPEKDKPFTYFWIKYEKKDKKFLRITNNFFIEIS